MLVRPAADARFTVRALAACAFALAMALFAAPAQAQVFSPGALSKGHEPLDGISQCTKCHVEGGRHDNAKCLDCHKEIGRRIDAGAGYHDTVKGRGCHECHREHRGAKANLIEWLPSRDAFNHNATGWPLKGAHKKPECTDCHETRRIDDEAIRALVQKTGRDTFLGLSTRCVTTGQNFATRSSAPGSPEPKPRAVR